MRARIAVIVVSVLLLSIVSCINIKTCNSSADCAAGCTCIESACMFSGDSSGAIRTPSWLRATPGTYLVKLEWESIEGAKSYNIYRSRSSAVAISNGKVASSNAPSLDMTIQEASVYFFAVTAVNSNGEESALSPIASARPVLPAPIIPFVTNGPVYAIAVAGDGTTYIGGQFSKVGNPGSNKGSVVNGVERNNLAAFDANGNLILSWNPGTTGSDANTPGVVRSLAIDNDILYVGGEFIAIDQQLCMRLAALDFQGKSKGWCPSPDKTVRTIAVWQNIVYVGGDFGKIGANQSARLRIAAIGANGNATDWNPANGASNMTSVASVAVSGSTVYAAGIFLTLGGKASKNVTALEIAAPGDAVGSFSSSINFSPKTLGVYGNNLYVGGYDKLVALDATTGGLASWDPKAIDSSIGINDVSAISVFDSIVYTGGSFNHGTSVEGAMAFYDVASASAGKVKDLVTAINGNVYAFGNLGGSILIGGDFEAQINGSKYYYFALLPK